jgi:hypothetical protein
MTGISQLASSQFAVMASEGIFVVSWLFREAAFTAMSLCCFCMWANGAAAASRLIRLAMDQIGWDEW